MSGDNAPPEHSYRGLGRVTWAERMDRPNLSKTDAVRQTKARMVPAAATALHSHDADAFALKAERKMCGVVPQSWQGRRCALPLHPSRRGARQALSLPCASGPYRRSITRRETSLSLHPSSKGRSCPLHPRPFHGDQEQGAFAHPFLGTIPSTRRAFAPPGPLTGRCLLSLPGPAHRLGGRQPPRPPTNLEQVGYAPSPGPSCASPIFSGL